MDIFIEKPSYVHCMEFEAHRESIIDLLINEFTCISLFYECFFDWQVMYNPGLQEALMLPQVNVISCVYSALSAFYYLRLTKE